MARLRNPFRTSYGEWRLWVVVVATTVAIAAFMALFVVPVYFGYRESCHRTGDAMDATVRYDFFAGCLVEREPGRFFPLDQVRGEEL